MKQKFILLFSAVGLLFAALTQAQTGVFTGTTLVGDGSPADFDFYGDHIASNSDWLMVGAPREDIDFDNDGLDPAQGDIDPGAVYVYTRTAGGPVFHSKIQGEGNNVDPDSPGDRFGAGIVLQGDIMFVAAANDDNFPGFVDPTPDPAQDFFFAGQVYVFNYDAGNDSWVLVQKLISDEPNSFASFGARTDSSHMELFSFGNGQPDATIALIGEVENGSGVPPTLHVFKRKKNSDLWNRVQKAGAPSGVADALFADKVEGVGKLALVTESGIDDVLDPAVVHAYRINANGIVKFKGKLQPVQTLDSPNGPFDPLDCGIATFGNGLSAANGIAAIADPCDDTAANNAGAVFVYTVDDNGNNDPLSLAQTLPNPAAVAESFFGSNFGNGKQTVTTDGNLILVGTADVGGGTPQLDVELYAADANGVFVNTDSIPSPSPGLPGFEVYGQSVNLLGNDELAISQMTDGTAFTGQGRVFLFEIQ